MKFSKETEEEQVRKHTEIIKEVGHMKEAVGDMMHKLGNERTNKVAVWDQPNKEGNTALHLSTILGKSEATRLLLNHGADANIQNAHGLSAKQNPASNRLGSTRSKDGHRQIE